MKTLEFKLAINQAQQASIDQWLARLAWVWNAGLKLLEEDQQRYWRFRHQFPVPYGLRLRTNSRGRLVGAGIQVSKRGIKSCPIRTSGQRRRGNSVQPLPPGLCLRYRKGKITGMGVQKNRRGFKYCPIRQCQTIEDPKSYSSPVVTTTRLAPLTLQTSLQNSKQGCIINSS